MSAEKVDFEIDMDIFNPNGINLPIDSLNADLQLYNKPFLAKTWDKLPLLEAGKKTKITLPLSLEWKDLLRVGVNLLKMDHLPYSVKGQATVSGFNIPFTEQGFINLATGLKEK